MMPTTIKPFSELSVHLAVHKSINFPEFESQLTPDPADFCGSYMPADFISFTGTAIGLVDESSSVGVMMGTV
jgi:hypothetical protein